MGFDSRTVDFNMIPSEPKQPGWDRFWETLPELIFLICRLNC
jgi:hypothetical protein